MKVSNLSDIDMSDEQVKALIEAKKHGDRIREFIQAEVRRQVAEQIFNTLKDQTDRDIRIFHLMAQVDSIEKSIKDTNKKVTMIRNQIRKEKGRKPL
jgi:archaellum component FlaC